MPILGLPIASSCKMSSVMLKSIVRALHNYSTIFLTSTLGMGLRICLGLTTIQIHELRLRVRDARLSSYSSGHRDPILETKVLKVIRSILFEEMFAALVCSCDLRSVWRSPYITSMIMFVSFVESL